MKLHHTATALVGALVLSALWLPPSPAITADANTPDDTVMVVTANVAEAWDIADVRSHWDMNKFVHRVLDEFSYRPDILALQEVRRSSARYIARRLSDKSGQSYRVVVMPPKDPFFPYGRGRAGAKETSIVVNSKTMKVLNGGGYLATVAKKEYETEPHDPVFHQAYALLQKRGTNMKFATMSVHLLPRGYLVNSTIDKYYRNKWAKQMHKKLRGRYGHRPGIRYIMAGDFNQSGCLRGVGQDCRSRSPFWKTLTGFGYQDTAKKFGAIDFIWSKGMPGAMNAFDSGYKSLSTSEAYSDHPFRWTILGPDRYAPTPPKPVTLDLREKSGGDGPVVHIDWGVSDDRAGTGVEGIMLERKKNDELWERIDPSHPSGHFDVDLDWTDTVRYRVRAWDRAQNHSPYLRPSVEVLESNIDSV